MVVRPLTLLMQGITSTPVIDLRGSGTIFVGATTTTDGGKTIKYTSALCAVRNPSWCFAVTYLMRLSILQGEGVRAKFGRWLDFARMASRRRVRHACAP